MEQADFLRGLLPEAATAIEQNRGSILSARRRILDHLVTATAEEDGDGLLEQCLGSLQQVLGSELLSFLIVMDSYYLDSDARARDDLNFRPDLSPGGLTNLVEVIGHTELELISRPLDKLIQSVAEEHIESVFNADEPIVAYVLAASTENGSQLNAALDEYNSLYRQSVEYWENVQRRFSDWFTSEVRNLPVNEPASDLEDAVDAALSTATSDSLLELDAGEQETVETPCDQQEPLPSAEQEQHQYKFECKTGIWHVSFQAKANRLDHLDGFFYISRLLERSRESISSVQLHEQITQWKKNDTRLEDRGDARSGTAGSVSVGPDDGLSLSAGDAGEVLDAQALNEYRNVIVTLDQKIAQAKAKVDGEAVVRHREEREFIQQQIDSGTDHRGRLRRLMWKAVISGSFH